MFDLVSLDTRTPMDSGAKMNLLHPSTGAVVRGDDGEPVYISLLGRDSERVRNAQHDLQNRRLDQVRRQSNAKLTAEDNERDLIDVLVAATTGWNIPTFEGEPFPYNERNARRFWSDDRFMHIRRQADTFISDYSNFLKG